MTDRKITAQIANYSATKIKVNLTTNVNDYYLY